MSLFLISCDEAPPPDLAKDASPQASPAPLGTSERPGIRFDPATTRRGDSVGVLVVDLLDASRSVVDSTYVGTARFRGQIEVTGRTVPHFDPDLRDEGVCFEADSASAAHLPRWLHDERRPWFCFSNPAEAGRALNPLSPLLHVRIVIEDFLIHRGLSDQVNTARFVERVGTERSGS